MAFKDILYNLCRDAFFLFLFCRLCKSIYVDYVSPWLGQSIVDREAERDELIQLKQKAYLATVDAVEQVKKVEASISLGKKSLRLWLEGLQERESLKNCLKKKEETAYRKRMHVKQKLCKKYVDFQNSMVLLEKEIELEVAKALSGKEGCEKLSSAIERLT